MVLLCPPTKNELKQAKGISRPGSAAKEKFAQLEANEAPLAPNTISVRDESEIRSVKLHARGDHTQLIGEEIPEVFLQVSDHLVPPRPSSQTPAGLILHRGCCIPNTPSLPVSS